MKTTLASLAAVMLLTLLAGCGSDSTGPSDPVWEETTVDGFTLGWLANDSTLEVEVTGPTTGWVAVGFDPSFQMQDANIIIGCRTDMLSLVRDDWGNSPTTHRADTTLGGSHDILAYQCAEAGGTTTLSFTIPMDSGDGFDKVLERGGSYTVILAGGPDGVDDFSTQHEFIAQTTIQLQ